MIGHNEECLTANLWLGEEKEIGVFSVQNTHGSIFLRLFPEYEIFAITPDMDLNNTDWANHKPSLRLSDMSDRARFMRLSIVAMREQSAHYNHSDYVNFLMNELAEDERHKLKVGAHLLKNDFDLKFEAMASSLLDALAVNMSKFYERYLALLHEWDAGTEHRFDVTEEKFIERSIRQWETTDEDGEKSQTSLLHAYWIYPILRALWADLSEIAYKIPFARKNVPEMILEVAAAQPTEVCFEAARYQFDNNIWLDLGGFKNAGLSPNAVQRVLAQHDQAYLIDILKLLTTLYIERADIQITSRLNIPRRYAGLTQMLSERYGTANNGESRAKVVDACRFLDAVRWGTDFENHRKLVSFEGLSRHDELVITYLQGFIKPIRAGERLVPILEHPKGSTRNRAHYNRLGLALGCLLVDESHQYLSAAGWGIPLNDNAYSRLQRDTGFSRRSKLSAALQAFEKDGAIEINDGIIRLGEKNRAGEKLILDGESNRKKQARRGRKGRRNRWKT